MLIRISLIVAILAGLAVGALNFTMVKDKVTALASDRDNEKKMKVTAQDDARKTHKELDKTTAELKQTKATLEATTTERDNAVAEADKQTKRADKLAGDLKQTTAEKEAAQQELAAYKATGYEPKQILAMAASITDLNKTLTGIQAENKAFAMKIDQLKTELERYRTPDFHVPLPANLIGKILVSDPKWNFVVLDIGENQRVKESGEMLVNRNGKLVAKVIVRSLQKDRSIANVLPGWEVGDVLEGDQVIPAYPEQ